MRINTSGWVFIILGAALIIAAYRFGFPGLLPLGILFIGLVLFSLLSALLTSSRLSAELIADSTALDGTAITKVGAELIITARVANSLPAPLLPFVLTMHTRPGLGPDQEAHVGMLAPNASADVQAVFIPTRRGMTGIDRVSAYVDGPFGLVSSQRSLQGSLEAAVAPAEADVGIPQSLSAHLSRVTTDRVSRGTGARDYFTREYAPGDDLRHIHWKTTARLGDLAVRQEAEEDHATAVVVLDGGRETGQPSSGQRDGASDPRFESLAAAAAAAVRTYFAAGYEVRLLCGDEDISLEARSLDLPRAERAIAAADDSRVPGGVRLPRNIETVIVCMDRSGLQFSVPPRARVWSAADLPAGVGENADPVMAPRWNLADRRSR